MESSHCHTNKRVLIAAGGTGGHVFPALAVAKELIAAGYHVEWLGTQRGIESRLVPQNGLLLHTIAVRALRGQRFVSLLLMPWRLLRALYQAVSVLRRVKPDLVLAMGGFAAGPGGLAAWLLRVPLLVHEQNAVAGLTNRVLAHFASRVLQAFPQAFAGRHTAILTGNPVRAAITAIAGPEARLAKRSGELRILVLGGSQGAKALNQCVPDALAHLAEQATPAEQSSVGLAVWHQTGQPDLAETKERYHAVLAEARVEPFIEDMVAAYSWADLVVCRAGALTLSELTAVGLPAIVVPYPFATDDHQAHNARYLVEGHAAIMIRQQALEAQALAQQFKQYRDDRALLLGMAMAARKLGRREALGDVVQHCMELSCGAT